VAVDRSAPTGNRLLAWLPGPARRDVARRCSERRFDFEDAVYEQDGAIATVVFPLTAVFSLISTLADGRGAEVATVGNEGIIGLPLFLEPRLPPAHRAIAQIAGTGLVAPADDFLDAARKSELLRAALHGYTHAVLTQIAQGSMCNRRHSVEQRCVRWLLQTHDRVGEDQFRLTQDFLGQMLGAGRETVNYAAGQLQRAGLIRYARGTMTIVSRRGLEEAACECYRRTRTQFERLFELPFED
jgi:CRP-like cAMP-binding protein